MTKRLIVIGKALSHNTISLNAVYRGAGIKAVICQDGSFSEGESYLVTIKNTELDGKYLNGTLIKKKLIS